MDNDTPRRETSPAQRGARSGSIRPPPYHALQSATVATRGNGFRLFRPLFEAVGFATDCHRLHPRGSIEAPSFVVRVGDIGPMTAEEAAAGQLERCGWSVIRSLILAAPHVLTGPAARIHRRNTVAQTSRTRSWIVARTRRMKICSIASRTAMPPVMLRMIAPSPNANRTGTAWTARRGSQGLRPVCWC